MDLELEALMLQYFILLGSCLVVSNLEQSVAQIESAQEMRGPVIHAFLEAFDSIFKVSHIQVINSNYEMVVRILAERIGLLLLQHQDFEPHRVKPFLHLSEIYGKAS